MRLQTIRCFSSAHQMLDNLSDLDHTLRNFCFTGRLSKAVRILCGKGSQTHPQTYAFLLQECINLKDLDKGRRLHTQMIVSGFKLDEYLHTKLIILYAKNGELMSAHHLFDKTPQRNLVSWNVMISGYVQKGLYIEGLNLYYCMRWIGLRPDQFTFASVFRAYASLASLEQGRRAHGVMIKSRIKSNVVVYSALVDMYFKCSSPQDGHLAFVKSPERNVVTWTALIAGYGQHGCASEVLTLFDQMVAEGFTPNHVTFLVVLSACSRGGLIDKGWKLFNSMTGCYGVRPRVEHYAAMVDLLGRAGRLDDAYELVQRSSSSGEYPVIWGALLGGSRIHGDLQLARLAASKFFELDPNNAGKYTVLSNAYADFGLWEDVERVREMMRRTRMRKDPAWSWIEVRGVVHTFLVGDQSHQQIEWIRETVKQLSHILSEAVYVPDLEGDHVGTYYED
eukprot:TRINITY_DN14620_c1_g1_i1.p1 TRINITY_DN14620_c1_g1~~TRINITY_DN14620_c1_g1_i1.p1  ORF type:complete len:450 (+),score=39.17 TRINITY_DN14620_c1_g1_i1:45-1394(+)